MECSGCVCATTRRHQLHVMAVLSGTRIVRVLCVCVVPPCWRAADVGARDATECARCRLTSHVTISTKRFLFLTIPIRRNCAKFVSESNKDLNRL